MHSVSVTALDFVRFVVPKPGIVMQIIFSFGRARRSKALSATSRASAESSPPEMPMTAFLSPICSILFASPAAWILNISAQRTRLTFSSEGTNGCASKVLSISLSLSSGRVISTRLISRSA